MNKTQQKRINAIREAINDLENGLNGKPFTWGDTERRHKEHILACLGHIVVSESRLKRGGHELKPLAQPIGTAYFGSPIRKTANLYLIGVQTRRSPKYGDLLPKGKALSEYQISRDEYAFRKEYFETVYGWKLKAALRATTEMIGQLVAALDKHGMVIDKENGKTLREQIAANAALLENDPADKKR